MACVRKTIEQDTDFLRRHDAFRREVEAVVDMPDRTLDLLFRLLHQNGGQLSARARERELVALTDAEAERIEQAYGAAFGGMAGLMSALQRL
jgi:hypothetical protein